MHNPQLAASDSVSFFCLVQRLFESFALRPDLGRALRASVAFVIPLLICHAMGRMSDAVFVAMAAQTIALPDLRGPYGTRLLILATMIVTVAVAAMLGVWAGGGLWSATLAMGFIALLGGAWRHLSADYGPPLSVSSALLFLLGLSQAGPLSTGLHLAGLILIGGAGAALLHIVVWPLRPQHPLRYAVAETWVAASDLVASMRPLPEEKGEDLGERERDLRAALDRTFVILGAAQGRRPTTLLRHLEDMRVEVVHLTMRALAFHTALEPLMARPEFARHLPTVDSVLKALSDAARSVAITIVTHRAVNFSVTEVRLQRCLHLIQVLTDEMGVPASGFQMAQAAAALDQIAQVLPRIRDALGETIDHAQGAGGFPARLPDLSRRPMRALAAWINPAAQLDPVLLRYSLRMAVLTMLAVLAYRGFAIPRGYWIAFTIVVVLQPDYGSTRKRAGERIVGTLAGSLLGSALLWIRMPVFLLDACAALMAFGFAYFLRRRYDIAIFFVTLMLVLIMGTMAPVHLDFTVTRLLCTVAGGVVALASALAFWPIWEGDKFNGLLAAAVRANGVYLQSLGTVLVNEQPPGHDLLMVKRRAENANREASASLQRLLAEPSSHIAAPERVIALTTYNQRITRALTAMAVHLPAKPVSKDDGLLTTMAAVQPIIETLAQAIEEKAGVSARTELNRQLNHLENSAACDASPMGLVWTHLAKGIAEIRAMALVLHAAEIIPTSRTVHSRRSDAEAMG